MSDELVKALFNFVDDDSCKKGDDVSKLTNDILKMSESEVDSALKLMYVDDQIVDGWSRYFRAIDELGGSAGAIDELGSSAGAIDELGSSADAIDELGGSADAIDELGGSRITKVKKQTGLRRIRGKKKKRIKYKLKRVGVRAKEIVRGDIFKVLSVLVAFTLGVLTINHTSRGNLFDFRDRPSNHYTTLYPKQSKYDPVAIGKSEYTPHRR